MGRHPRMTGAGVLAGLVLSACSSAVDTGPGGVGPANGDPCAAARCGVACSSTANCDPGTYCKPDGTCGGECTQAADNCGPGRACTSYGACAYTEADPQNGVCAARMIEADLTIPTVVILVDQSTSMDTSYPGGTRWSVLRDALIDPTSGVIARLESNVRFGLTLYTSHGGGPTCPVLTQVTPAIDNLDAITEVYADAGPQGDTPTGESVDAIVSQLVADADGTPQYIVLATDGEPDTCAVPNPQTGQPESIAAAQNAHDHGIDLFILSVGQGDVSLQHLQDVANAGVGLPVGGSTNAPYYEANDQEELASAFDTIIGRMLSCTVIVDGTIDVDNEGAGQVVLDGDPVPYGGADGWERLDATSIRLNGAACERAQSPGAHTVTIVFPCWEPPV